MLHFTNDCLRDFNNFLQLIFLLHKIKAERNLMLSEKHHKYKTNNIIV